MKVSSISPFVNSLPKWLIPTGSYKRYQDMPNKIINDLDLLTFKPIDDTLKYFEKKHSIIVNKKGEKHIKMKIDNKYSIDIWITNKSDLPFAQLHYDSGKAILQYKSIAKKHGYLLNQYGLFKHKEKIKKRFKGKEDIINFLNNL